MMIPLFLLMAAAAADAAARAAADATPDVPAAGPDRVQCIHMRHVRDSRLSREGGYFVRVGQQWWRNTANDCPLFGADRSVRIVTTINRQCRGDQFQVFQNFTNLDFGTCVLSEWEKVPADIVPSGRRPRD